MEQGNVPDMPEIQIGTPRALAIHTHVLFMEFVEAGFTETQAIHLLGSWMGHMGDGGQQ